MVSKRALLDRQKSQLQLALEAERSAGRALIDLTVSNPTQVKLPYPWSKLGAAISDGAGCRYEAHSFGHPGARQTIARHWLARGVTAYPSSICLTASTSEAYGYLFKLLCDPGDEVLVPAPSYPLLAHLARYEGVALRSYRLALDDGWHIDFDSIRGQLTGKVRAIIIVSPNNPTGSIISSHELEELMRFDLPIISDEVFAEYSFGAPVPSALSGATDGLVFALDGLSKRALLPQLKLGWITASGDSSRVEEALHSLEFIADTYLSVNTPVQNGLDQLLRHSEVTRGVLVERLAANLAQATRLLADSCLTVLPPAGGWNVVVRLPATRSEHDWVHGLLREEHVVVQPGWFYDFASEAFVVLSLMTEPEQFSEGVERLRDYVERVEGR